MRLRIPFEYFVPNGNEFVIFVAGRLAERQVGNLPTSCKRYLLAVLNFLRADGLQTVKDAALLHEEWRKKDIFMMEDVKTSQLNPAKDSYV